MVLRNVFAPMKTFFEIQNLIFPTQQMAQIDWRFERKLKPIHPINDH